jgi:hypothetical protein
VQERLAAIGLVRDEPVPYAGWRCQEARVSDLACAPLLGAAATPPDGLVLRTHLPLMTNSDHAHFAVQGVPAARLVAGSNEAGSALRYLLTGADTRAVVPLQELKAATIIAGALLWAALTAPAETLPRLR